MQKPGIMGKNQVQRTVILFLTGDIDQALNHIEKWIAWFEFRMAISPDLDFLRKE